MGRGFVAGWHVDLQLDGLLSVQFGRPDDRELAVSDLGADTGRIEGEPEGERRTALTPDVLEVIDRHGRPGQLQPALVEVGGVAVDVVVQGGLGGHLEGVLQVFKHRPVRPEAEDMKMYLLATPGIGRRLPRPPTGRRSAMRVQDVAAGGVDGREQRVRSSGAAMFVAGAGPWATAVITAAAVTAPGGGQGQAYAQGLPPPLPVPFRMFWRQGPARPA